MSHPITLFHKIIHPLWQFVENSEYHPTDDPAKILDFRAFIRILLYYYLGDADSARSLINDLNNDEECVLEAGLTPCGLSTIHDAFARYANGLFQRLYQALLQKIPMPSIKEFNELGKLTCVDSSVFPLSLNCYWAIYKERANALKMYLCFPLNQMLPVCFLTSAAKIDDRKVFRELIEAGITYIADRGYLDLKLFAKIVDMGAHFVIRVRKNLKYHVEQVLPVELIDSVKFIFFQVTDEIVRFECDPDRLLYRRIAFRTRKTFFVLVTDRLDLTIFEVIKLYCLRWQIELFFRYMKCTVGAQHLINKPETGVTIQFYMIMMVHLLLMAFKKMQYQQCLFDKQQLALAKAEKNNKQAVAYQKKIFRSTEEFVAEIGGIIPSLYKINKQEWRTVRKKLLKTDVQFCFNFP